ncbi:hypothetical protein ZEAMMB73_Zm00001d043844 [Zea mays]|uniref:HAT C-terminal dimerisation domain-containing protein n=1 Tax=Zea mays TaxID=4577 RepID=A0A1D6NFG9_MAIZE|nr:hypothetical protein ZEAMMB73_Zm00001d043844 [Zea mays]
MRGGIYRLKEHLAHVGKNVKKCTSATPQALEAKEKCKKAIEAAKRKREEKTVRELELREEVNVSRVGEESEEVTCVGSSQPHKLGPIDKWTRAIDPTKADSFKQQQLNKELWKEREHEVHKFIARWAYNHGIPFNACDNDEFKQMCEAIGQFGPGLTPPTQDAFRASWWRLYGTETPALQKMATRILSLTSSSSGCERNWSGFEGIHTKKRNRLTTTRLNKLVYIQFNNRLMNNREKIKSKKITDVLLSSDTTEAQDSTRIAAATTLKIKNTFWTPGIVQDTDKFF